MSRYFFDTSALFKRYWNEVGSAWVQVETSQSNQNTIIVAQITDVELMSVAARLMREHKLNSRMFQAIRLTVHRHMERQCRIIALNTDVSQTAQSLLKTYPLRAADAIQLASATVANRILSAGKQTPLTFVSSDARLLNAAAQAGMPIHEPK